MHTINRLLKFKLLLLSLIFPVSFAIAGFTMGWYLHIFNLSITFSLAGLAFGILLNFICHSRKLFTLALFYTPIPLALFMLSWWIADAFTNSSLSLIIGLIGFAIGLWLNFELVLPYQFFKIKKRILAVVYFFFSLSCLGFFMGIPVFNILLGVLAGNYLSIRVMENYRRQAFVTKNLKQGALFTATVLFVIILCSGFVALTDLQNSLQMAERILHISLNSTQFNWLIVSSGIFLVIFQYFITLFTAKTMFEYWVQGKTI